jgi:hypothetical protein
MTSTTRYISLLHLKTRARVSTTLTVPPLQPPPAPSSSLRSRPRRPFPGIPPLSASPLHTLPSATPDPVTAAVYSPLAPSSRRVPPCHPPLRSATTASAPLVPSVASANQHPSLSLLPGSPRPTLSLAIPRPRPKSPPRLSVLAQALHGRRSRNPRPLRPALSASVVSLEGDSSIRVRSLWLLHSQTSSTSISRVFAATAHGCHSGPRQCRPSSSPRLRAHIPCPRLPSPANAWNHQAPIAPLPAQG